MTHFHYKNIQQALSEGKKLLAILIDPEKFDTKNTASFISKIPQATTHLLVGGSTDQDNRTHTVVQSLKEYAHLPVILFPGHYQQISEKADAILLLSLLSGRNPEYLIGQHVKAVPKLKQSRLEILPTGYLLLDGGTSSAVSRVSETSPMSQEAIDKVVDTALAGSYLGAKFIYLEAGSGAVIPVRLEIISAVKNQITIPLIVGGGIRTEKQKEAAFQAGADMVVMGTVFENDGFSH